MTRPTHHDEFWTPDRIAASQAMRCYRSLWAACSEWEQWRLRGHVHAMRGAGIPEAHIGFQIREMVSRMRPWRLLDADLVKALKARHKERRRMMKRRAARTKVAAVGPTEAHSARRGLANLRGETAGETR